MALKHTPQQTALIAQEIGAEVIRGPLSLLSDWVE